MTIILNITYTCKSYSPRAQWSVCGDEQKRFPDMKAARAWIKQTYGKSRRAPMYVDLKSGETKRMGYVIGYRDVYDKILRQDWLSFSELTPVYL